MALVKKYGTGGSYAAATPPSGNTYKDFLVKKLAETKFTTKGKGIAQDVTQNFIDLYDSGDLDKAYSYDPVHEEYIIDTQKITKRPELKNIDWSGSKDAINRNILGAYSGKGDKSNKDDSNAEQKKFNSLVASWTNEFLGQKQTQAVTQTPARTPLEKDLRSLQDYAVETRFGNDPKLFRQYLGSIPYEEKQKETAKLGLEHVNQYLDDFNKNKDVDKFDHVTEAQDLQNTLKGLDLTQSIPEDKWKEISNKYYKLGWNPEGFMGDKPDQEKIKEEEVAKTTNAFKEELLKRGVNPTLADNIIAAEYTQFNDSIPDATDNVKSKLAEEEIFVLANKYGHQKMFNNSGEITSPILFDNPTKPEYGYTLQSKNNKLIYQKDPTNFKDPAQGKALRPLNAKLDLEGEWVVSGVPQIENGSANYLNHIYAENSNTNERIELYKDPKDGQYKTENGKVHNIDIKSYGNYTPESTPSPYFWKAGKEEKEFDSIPTIPTNESVDSIPEAEEIQFNRNSAQELIQYIGKLKHIINKPNAYYDKSQAVRKYRDLINRINSDKLGLKTQILRGAPSTTTPAGTTNTLEGSNIFNKVNNWLAEYGKNYAKKQTPLFHKEGGILKLQKAGTLSRISQEEYVSKYAPKTQEAVPESKVKDIRGSFADMSGAQKVSLIGAAASILPGVGVIGAGVTTVADIIEDINNNDGQINWGTHTTNALFMGLSAAGLGGIRAVQAAFKAANIAKIGATEAKVANAVNKMATAAELDAMLLKVNKAAKNVSLGKGIGLTKEEIVLLKENNVLKAGVNAGNIAPKTLKPALISAVEKATNIETKAKIAAEKAAEIARPNLLQREFAGTIGLVKGVTPTLQTLGTAVKTVGIGAGVVLGGSSALSAISDYKEAGTEGLQVNDVKNLLYTAGGVRGILKNRQLAQQAKKLMVKGEASDIIQIGGKKLPVLEGQNSSIELPTLGKTKWGVTAKNAEANAAIDKTKTEELKKFQFLLSEKVGANNVPKDLKQLEKLIEKGQIGPGSTTSFVAKKDSGLPGADYDRIKNVLESGKHTSYGLPNWLRNNYVNFKKGGIMKFQTGKDIQFGVPKYNIKDILKKPFGKNKLYSTTMEDLYWNTKDDRVGIDPVSGLVNYTQKHIDNVNNLNGDWWNKYGSTVQKAATDQGSTYQVKDLKDFQRLALDRKPGYLHNLDIPLINPNVDTPKTTETPGETTPVVPTTPGTPFAPIPTTPFKTTSLVDYAAKKYFKPDLANPLMAAITIGANRIIGNEQRKAAVEIPRLSGMPLIYTRVTRNNEALASEQIGQMSSAANRIANSTPDLGRSDSVRMAGTFQVQGLKNKAQQADIAQGAALKAQESATNQRINQFNIGINNQNNTVAAGARSKIHLINANQRLANNAALNNLMLAEAKAQPMREFKRASFDLDQGLKNPNLKIIGEDITKLRGPEGQKYYRDLYDQENKDNVKKVEFEKSERFKQWQEAIKAAEARMTPYADVVSNLRSRVALANPYFGAYAKGGSMSKRDRIDLENVKQAHKKEIKDQELLYKAIFHNNELLQKTLIKVFK